MLRHRNTARADRAGSALMGVVLLGSVLGALSLSALTMTSAAMREQKSQRQVAGVRCIAEAGVGEAVFELSTGGDGSVGSADAPVPFGGGSYWVRRMAGGGDLVLLVSAAELNGSVSRLQVLLRGERVSPYRWAAFADEALTQEENAFVDSYDPDEGSYPDQAIHEWQGHPFAGELGSIGSNGDVVVRGDAQVHGDARAGPGAVTTVREDAYVSGATAPRNELVRLHGFEIPELPSGGPLAVLPLGVETVPSGMHAYDELGVGYRGTLLITGPATVVFDSVMMDASSQILVDPEAGPVEIYVRSDFLLGAGVRIASTTRDPADVALYLAADNVAHPEVEIDLDGTSIGSTTRIYGTVYAPRAALDIRKDVRIFGSLSARRLVLGGDVKIHYDQGIVEARGGVMRNFETIAWRVLPRQEPAGPPQ